ncbi:MAG: glycosyltransferase [Clostridia bacterium]|nr:glycosyltransferase [Clostridia bacterium]
MNILVTVNKRYIEKLNVLLNSIKYSNKNEKFDIYILHKDLKKQDLNVIQRGLDPKQFNIIDIQISRSEIDKFPVYQRRYPVEIYFRIFATKYLPDTMDRILYLDSDTLIINSLKELYDMDFESNYYIASTHIRKMLHKFHEIRLDMNEEEPYINTGVLLINLKELRKIQLEKEVIQFVKKNEKKLMLPDQDIISALYGDKIKLVDPLKYNLGDRALMLYNLNNPKNKITLKWICKNTVIIHYYGRNKPWNKEYIGKLDVFYHRIQKRMKKDGNKRVLLLSCGTGGGHNSAALAVQEALLSKNVDADFREYLDITNPNIKDYINHLYIKSTNGEGKVFKTVYHLGELYGKTNLKSPVYTLNSLNNNKLYKYIQSKQYDYVVTTHLFAAQALTAIKKEYPIHFMEIATDYVCIPFWEETNPDYFVIPSQELEQEFLNKGFQKEKLLSIGIPVSLKYSEEYDQEEIKKELGLAKNKKYVLILTGSMGFGNITDMLKELMKKIKDVGFIIACGSNHKLFDELTKKYRKNKSVIALPFTNELDQYMKGSDVILSKPGGLTTTEIATLRKPFIHTMPIPGCENYNANFFSDRGMSFQCENIDEVVKNTKTLLDDKALQIEMIESQKRYISKNTCNDIADIIIKEMEKKSEERKSLLK